MQENSPRTTESLRPERFVLWTPPPGRAVASGAERTETVLPQLPLPLHREDLADDGPSDDAIGKGIYDYLRQFPDCPHNADYAGLLRDLYPHYLADMGAQIVMLEHKEVDAPYIRRQISFLKILALLDRENGALWQRLGMSCYELALMFAELAGCRRYLLEAMGHFRRAAEFGADDTTTSNYLGQIDYLLGDYPGALRHWKSVVEALGDSLARSALGDKVARIEAQSVPDHPLIDDLERIAAAMELLGAGEVEEARLLLERLEEQGSVTTELPSPEFFYLLGVSRGRCGDSAGAFEAFEKALGIDSGFAPAQEGRERILEGKEL